MVNNAPPILNNGDGAFTRISTGSIVTEGGNSSACVWGDFDNDGFLDLFVTNPGGDFSARPSFLYRNKGDGTFEKITSGRIVTDRRVTFDATWADYDRDGYIDLFVGDFGEANNALYRNNSGRTFDRTFDRIAAGPIVNEGGSSVSSAWADYDNDGFADLFVVNFDRNLPPNNYLYRNKGDGTFLKITTGSVVKGGLTALGCAWGDYDNDGFLDLFITQVEQLNVEQDNVLYHNNGYGTFTKVLEGSLVNDGGVSDGCAWADYDNDGFLDLFVANGSPLGAGTYRNFLYRNDANTNQWIKLKLVGTVSNRAAIGAKIRVKATIGGHTVWQLREISGGGGWTGQNSLVAHFGLRDATIIDTIRIEWPSGVVQEMHNVAVKRLLTVTEPARLQVSWAGMFRVQSWKGMAFESQASTDLNQWTPMTTVTNLTGTLEFTDSDAANHLRRFYRTVLRN